MFSIPRLNKSHGDKSAEELGKQAGGKLSSDLKSRLTPLTGERVYIVRTEQGIEIILRDEISTYEHPIATMTAHGIAKDGKIHPFVSFSPGKPSTHGVKVSDDANYRLLPLSGSQELFPGQRIILQAGGRPEYTLPTNTDSFMDFLKFDPRLANLGVGESLRIGRAPFPFNEIVIADNPTVSLVHATVKKLPNGNFLVTDGMVGSEQLSLKLKFGWAPIKNPISLLPGAEVKIGVTIFKIPEMLRLR